MNPFLVNQELLKALFKNAQAIKKVHPTLIEVKSETDTNVEWLVLVSPWGGDKAQEINGKKWEYDLGGDYFYPDYTDFGDQKVKTLKAFYEHNINSLVNPLMPEDQQMLGTATLVKTDDWGRWFKFEIDRTKPYYEYLEALKSLNLLGSSSQAFMGGVTRESDGRLKRWWENEASLTPTPMNPTSIAQVYDLAKTFRMPFADAEYQKALMLFKNLDLTQRSLFMGAELKDAENVEKTEANLEGTVQAETSPVSSTEEPAVEESTEETQADKPDDLDSELKSIFAGNTKTEDAKIHIKANEEGEIEVDLATLNEMDLKTLLKTFIEESLKTRQELKALSTYIGTYIDAWGNVEDLPQLIAMMTGIQQATAKSASDVAQLKGGMKTLAEEMVKAMRGEIQDSVTEELKKSDMERTAEFEQKTVPVPVKRFDSTRSGHALKFPASAPGAAKAN